MKTKKNITVKERVKKKLNKVVSAESKMMNKEVETLNVKMRNHWAVIQKDLSLLSEDMNRGYSDIKKWLSAQDVKNMIKEKKLIWK